MNNTPRYLEPLVREDLSQKMVFLGGPRQVGKTTLSKQLLDKGLYLNWDNLHDRQQILNFSFSLNQPLVVFDEVHKYRLWRSVIKGLFDRIYPYGKNRTKAVKKAPKLFLWDWSQIQDSGAKFENMIASHLLKFCHYHEDVKGDKMQLCFIKDVENQKEVDFVILKNDKPLFAVECKSGEKSINKNLSFYQNKLSIPRIYQVHLGSKDIGLADKGGRMLSLPSLCEAEELV